MWMSISSPTGQLVTITAGPIALSETIQSAMTPLLRLITSTYCPLGIDIRWAKITLEVILWKTTFSHWIRAW